MTSNKFITEAAANIQAKTSLTFIQAVELAQNTARLADADNVIGYSAAMLAEVAIDLHEDAST